MEILCTLDLKGVRIGKHNLAISSIPLASVTNSSAKEFVAPWSLFFANKQNRRDRQQQPLHDRGQLRSRMLIFHSTRLNSVEPFATIDFSCHRFQESCWQLLNRNRVSCLNFIGVITKLLQ